MNHFDQMLEIDKGSIPNEMDFRSKMTTVKQNIHRLLIKFPYLADNYNALVWFYWNYIDQSWKYIKIIDGKPFIELNDTKFRLTMCETIGRVFREFTKEDLFLCEDCSRGFKTNRDAVKHMFKFRHKTMINQYLKPCLAMKIVREREFELFRNYYAASLTDGENSQGRLKVYD